MQNEKKHNIQEQQKNKKTQVKRPKSLWVLYIAGLLGEGVVLNLKPKFPLPSQTPDLDLGP
jgi:hypothetical protein